MTEHETGPAETRPAARLYRSRTERILGGVAGGMGQYFGVDPVWFRLGFVVLTLAGGSGLLVYLVAWIVVPEEPAEGAAAATPRTAGPEAAMLGGVILVAIGVILLINQFFPRFNEVLWPTVIVVAGIALIVMGVRRGQS